MKLTEWFPGDVKPVRDGVYQRDHISWRLCYSRFYKGSWRFPAATPEEATLYSSESDRQREPWRGLSADPQVSVRSPTPRRSPRSPSPRGG